MLAIATDETTATIMSTKSCLISPLGQLKTNAQCDNCKRQLSCTKQVVLGFTSHKELLKFGQHNPIVNKGVLVSSIITQQYPKI